MGWAREHGQSGIDSPGILVEIPPRTPPRRAVCSRNDGATFCGRLIRAASTSRRRIIGTAFISGLLHDNFSRYETFMSATCSVPVSATKTTRRAASVTRSGAIALSIRVLGAGGLLLSHIVLARSLGPAGFAEYSLAFAWAQILCVFAKLGIDNTVLRYIAEYTAKNELAKRAAITRDSTFVSMAASGLVSLGFSAVVLLSWNAIGDRLASCMLLAAAMIPLLSSRQIQEAGLRSAGKLFESQISTALWPVILFVLAGTAWLLASPTNPVSSSTAMILHLTSILSMSGLVLYFIQRSPLRLSSQEIDGSDRSAWVRTAMAFFAAEILVILKSRISIAIAGATLVAEESAGLYGAMERFADVSILGSQSLGLVIAPQFASLYAAGRFSDMRRLVVQGQALCVAFTLPVAIGVACFGDAIFALIGRDYQPGYQVLIALLVSACIASFSGTSAYVLQMTGRERTLLGITGLCAGVNVAVSLLLIRPCGLLGLGIAQIATSLVWTIAVQFSLQNHPAWQSTSAIATPTPELNGEAPQ